MKKTVIYLLFFLVIVSSFPITYAKVLSEDYLQNVTQVTLKNGTLFKLCELKPIEPSVINDSKEVKNQGITAEDAKKIIPLSNIPSNSIPCDSPKDLILADLEYVYIDGQKGKVDRLFVFDDKLYRPDSIGFEYYPDTKNQLQSQNISELLLTDPKLPNGQKSTGGTISIHYKQENPKELIIPSGGESPIFLAGEIDGLVMKLDGKEYAASKKEKEVTDVVLLTITRPTLTPIPTLSILPTPSSKFAPGEVLVKFKANVSTTEARSIIDSLGAVEISEISQIGLRHLKVTVGKEEQVLTTLKDNLQVEYAELNYTNNIDNNSPNLH